MKKMIDEQNDALKETKQEVENARDEFFGKTKEALKENLVKEILETATKEQLAGMGIDGWIKIAVGFAVDTTVEVMVKPLVKKEEKE